jgi:hypothetical protein
MIESKIYYKLREVVINKRNKKVFKISFNFFTLFIFAMVTKVFNIVPEFELILSLIGNNAIYQTFMSIFTPIGLLAGFIFFAGGCIMFILSLYHLNDAYKELQLAKKQ